MNNVIEDLKISPLLETNYIKPLKVNFTLNGAKKSWEAVRSHDSVSVLLYHIEKKAFLLVKQFRVPVFLNDNNILYTYELCAGLVDKNISLEKIVCEEIDEECGYKVDAEDLTKITSFFTNVGISGAKQHLYFATICENQKISSGGGINDEQIELYFLDFENIDDFIFDESKAKTPGLIFSLYWFLKNQKELGF